MTARTAVAISSVVAALASAGCASFSSGRADGRSAAKAQVEFGIKVARQSLWKEAVNRFERATEIDKTYGFAWNNLGIAYEQMGRFDDARKAYEKALSLEPDNTFILTNYDLFREIYDNQNRRRVR